MHASLDTGVRYRIDHQDVIVFVDEAWQRFARDNDGADLGGTAVLGRVLWDFIADETTRHLYRRIVARARAGCPVRFTLRCDSPTRRRRLEMQVRGEPAGDIEFVTVLLEQEDRLAMPLLGRDTPRGEELVRMCSWCNHIEVGPGAWAEVEHAIQHLKLFEVHPMPLLTHGICATCLTAIQQTLAEATTSR